MDVTTWLAVGTLLVASYLSTLHLSLQGVSHSGLLRRLAVLGRAEAGRWLLERHRATLLCSSLGLSLLRVAFFMLILVGVVGLGEQVRLTTQDLLIASGIAVVLLWLFTAALSSAIARHAGTGVVLRAMPLLKLLTWAGLPLARALHVMDEAVRRLTGANVSNGDEAEAELLRSIEDSHLQGQLDEDAAELLENVVDFRSTDVGEVMTPRTDIKGIEVTDDLGFIRKVISELGYSRIPVYRENLDNILGILYVKDLIPYLGTEARAFKLEPMLRQPMRVPETKPVADLLEDFQRSEVHMAVVIDEYGGTAGLVTIEDVLEELVGEIQDEHDSAGDVAPTLVTIDGSRAEVDGRYHIDDLNEELGLDLPEDEEFDTIAGFVLAKLGRVPDVGESFESNNARFTAIDATPTNVRKVQVELMVPTPRANGETGDAA